MRSYFNDTARRLGVVAMAMCVLGAFATPVQGETPSTRMGELEFKAGYPTQATVELLYDELDFQRAVQAYLWSLTVYDNDTRSMIRNQDGRPLVGSVHGAVANDDGSFDLYFGPNRPADVTEQNWVQTKPGKGWFVYLRLYGPEQPYFDKIWKPSDLELVE